MKILDMMQEKLNRSQCDKDRRNERRQTNDPALYFGYFAPEGIERRRCDSIFTP